MIVANINIKVEYTSEDGLVYWTKVSTTDKQHDKRTTDLGGTDSFNVVVSDIRRHLGIKTIRNR
jgi:hypothetical protein